MHIFILAAAMLILAAVLWYRQASGTAEEMPPPEMDAAQRLRRVLAENQRMVDALAAAVQALETIMAHPQLGGPGFLLVQLPPAASGGYAMVTAQYPNIHEALYRRIVRQELERDDLAAAGVPESLLSLDPAFETESSSIVLLSVRVEGIPGAFMEKISDRKERNTALGILAEALEEKLPQLSVRILGMDLLLSPNRERAEASAG